MIQQHHSSYFIQNNHIKAWFKCFWLSVMDPDYTCGNPLRLRGRWTSLVCSIGSLRRRKISHADQFWSRWIMKNIGVFAASVAATSSTDLFIVSFDPMHYTNSIPPWDHILNDIWCIQLMWWYICDSLFFSI